uniref:Uncharacterized protein n=1 Tax=Romanomermis culicivorax TaxID=13658 RepID=A0A915LBG8_ROMCU
MPTSLMSAINEVTSSRRMTASVIKYLQTEHAKKTNRKSLYHALGQSLMEPKVLAQLKELEKAKKAKSTNMCRVFCIQWAIYKKKYKKDWVCCDEHDGWICFKCLAADFDPTLFSTIENLILLLLITAIEIEKTTTRASAVLGVFARLSSRTLFASWTFGAWESGLPGVAAVARLALTSGTS